MTALACMLALSLVPALVPTARADDPPDSVFEQTPPRLSLTDGQVSFWRPGAQDWTRAQINTPLAPGDVLSTGSPGTLEVQIGSRAFVRGWANTQLSLANQEPDFIQFTLPAGSAVFDLRTLEPGHAMEVDTPNAAVTIEQAGYYRIDVTGERSRVMTRRGGRATVTPASGQSVAITPSEELVIEGTGTPQLVTYAAPPLDDWDRWNYTRTDRLLDAASARYVAPGTYGLSELDPHGTWRVVPTYGTVWVPTGVPTGWAPYTTGSWILDPIYGWTWVDTAPWGWAPYHHGRWCFIDGFWAWAPGPVVVRPVYAPALVAFFDAPGRGVSLGPGGPAFGWVALGWGEPIVPWWGRRGVVRGPSWRGWGGPRVVNNVVVSHTTVVNVQSITVYRNASVPHAVVVVDRTRFGHGPIANARVAQLDPQRLRPLNAAPQIPVTPASFVPTTAPGLRPPEDRLKRPVVATRPARPASEPTPVGTRPGAPPAVSVPPPHLVAVPKPQEPVLVPPRPSFGHGTVERPMTDRRPTPAPPRLGAPPVGPLPPGHGGGPPPPARQVDIPSGAPKRPAWSPPAPGQIDGAPQMPGRGPASPGLSVKPAGPPPGTGQSDGAPQMPGREPASPGPSVKPAEPPPVTRQLNGAPQMPGREPASPGPSVKPAGPVPVTRQLDDAPRTLSHGPAASGPSMKPPGPAPVTRHPAGPPPTVRQGDTPPGPGRASGGPSPATGHAAGAPPPTVQHKATPRRPTHPLPGEPANQLAPDRIRTGPSPAGQSKS